jgi:CheY-like chemotaxis protein
MPSARPRPRRVLIVDDAQSVRHVLTRTLENAGVEVVGAAADGREAVELVEDLQPDVITMDLEMPVLDGAAATQLIFESGYTGSIVMLTATDSDPRLRSAFDAGAQCHVLKSNASTQLIPLIFAMPVR